MTRWAEREAGVGAGQRQLGRRGAGRAGGEREKEEADRAGLGSGPRGKGRKTGPAGERNRAGRRERGAWVGFGTKLGWVLSYFFLLFYF